MALSKFQKLSIAGAFGALAMGINLTPANDITLAPAAHAQTVKAVLPSQMAIKDCASREAILEGLRIEGQSILVAHDAIGYSAKDGSTQSKREVFSANESLSKGYHLSANLSGDFCKTAELKNIRLLDARQGKIDSAAYFTPASYDARGTLNGAITKSFKISGEVPMLQAYAPDNGVTITVLGNATSGEGAILFSTDNGMLNKFGGYLTANPKYSPTAIATLSRPVQTASIDLAAR